MKVGQKIYDSLCAPGLPKGKFVKQLLQLMFFFFFSILWNLRLKTYKPFLKEQGLGMIFLLVQKDVGKRLIYIKTEKTSHALLDFAVSLDSKKKLK